MSIHAGFLMLHKPDLKTTTVYNCLLNENCNNCEHCPMAISLFIVRSVSFLFSIFRCVKKFLQITMTNFNADAFVFIQFFVSLSFLAFFFVWVFLCTYFKLCLPKADGSIISRLVAVVMFCRPKCCHHTFSNGIATYTHY